VIPLLLALQLLLPPGTPPERSEALAARLDAARAQLAARSGGLDHDLEVVLCASTDEFVARSGRGRREAAAFADGRLFLQPLAVLERLADLDGALRHELAHALIAERWRKCRPARARWLHEGLATLLAEARLAYSGDRPFVPLDERAIEAALDHPRDDGERAWGYEAARRLVVARGGLRLLDRCP
jgi:hypothetical protein